MKELFRLAVKNLLRYKRRTLITASAIGVGLSLFIATDSLLKGASVQSIVNIVRYETGTAKIFAKGYKFTEPKLLKLIEDPSPVYAELDKARMKYTPRSVFPCQLILSQEPYNRGANMNVTAVAIDVERDSVVFDLESAKWISGGYLKKGEPGVIIGDWLADDIGAKNGYLLSLYARTKNGSQQLVDLTITGIFHTENPLVNGRYVYMDMDYANEVLDMGTAVSEIALAFPDSGQVYIDTIDKLSRRLPDYQVVGWEKQAENFIAIASGKQAGSYVILFLIFIIAAIGISNTMMMAVYERTREIGMMRALGMKDKSIRKLFLIESAGIGIVGSTMGILLGIILDILVIYVGLDYSNMLKGKDIGYRLAGVFRGAWNFETMFIAAFVCIVLCVLVAMFPTRRASKLKITDCLRQQ